MGKTHATLIDEQEDFSEPEGSVQLSESPTAYPAIPSKAPPPYDEHDEVRAILRTIYCDNVVKIIIPYHKPTMIEDMRYRFANRAHLINTIHFTVYDPTCWAFENAFLTLYKEEEFAAIREGIKIYETLKSSDKPNHIRNVLEWIYQLGIVGKKNVRKQKFYHSKTPFRA
jgi:hypothetical protein